MLDIKERITARRRWLMDEVVRLKRTATTTTTTQVMKIQKKLDRLQRELQQGWERISMMVGRKVPPGIQDE